MALFIYIANHMDYENTKKKRQELLQFGSRLDGALDQRDSGVDINPN